MQSHAMSFDDCFRSWPDFVSFSLILRPNTAPPPSVSICLACENDYWEPEAPLILLSVERAGRSGGGGGGWFGSWRS